MKKLSNLISAVIFLSLVQIVNVVQARATKKTGSGSATTAAVSDIYYESLFSAIKNGRNVILICGINQKDLIQLKPVYYSEGTWTIESAITLENGVSAQFINPYFSTGQWTEHKNNIMFLGSIIGTGIGIAEAGINVVDTNDVRFFYTTDLFASAIEISNCITLF